MEIKYLIIKSVFATLDEAEKQFLDTWLQADGHRTLYDRIAANLRMEGHAVEDLGEIDIEAALQQVHARIAEAAGEGHRRRPWDRVMRRVAAVAAVAVVVAGSVWWYEDYTRVTPPVLTAEIVDGIRSAARHDRLQPEAEAVQPSAPLTRQEIASYKLSENDAIAEAMLSAKRVKTYIDKEYWVTLPDGTLVHLADNSSLIYPERFDRGDRNVCIEGEGYFMVAHDRSRSFIVHTPHGQVVVHGTEFDVNTRDAQGTSVVLVNGRVGVRTTDGQEQEMVPGQKAAMTSGGVAMQQVDTAPYTAWNTGKVTFRGWPIQRIMPIIAKWYDRRVIYRSELSEQKTFTGSFDRFDSIESTVEALCAGTGLRIEIEKDQLIVY